MKVIIKFPFKNEYFADLVDIIRRDENLTKEQHLEYYDADPMVRLTSVDNTRLVFKKVNGGYTVIIPDVIPNRKYWKILRNQ